MARKKDDPGALPRQPVVGRDPVTGRFPKGGSPPRGVGWGGPAGGEGKGTRTAAEALARQGCRTPEEREAKKAERAERLDELLEHMADLGARSTSPMEVAAVVNAYSVNAGLRDAMKLEHSGPGGGAIRLMR